MIGAIIGDIVGSRFEFDDNNWFGICVRRFQKCRNL